MDDRQRTVSARGRPSSSVDASSGGASSGGASSEGAELWPPAPQDDEPTLEDVAELGGRSLLGLAALIAGAVPFLALVALVETRWPPLQRLDARVADALNAWVAGSPATVRVLDVVTDLGGAAVATVVITLVAGCLLVRRQVAPAAYLAVAGLGLGILSPVTKALVGRPRPDVALPVVELPTNASFPSGHAMTAAVTWGALLLVALPSLRPAARRVAVTVTALVVLAVGFTRLALGVHFVSDVVAGWGLGLAWLAVVTAGFRRWLRARGEPVGPVRTGIGIGIGAPRLGRRERRPRASSTGSVRRAAPPTRATSERNHHEQR